MPAVPCSSGYGHRIIAPSSHPVFTILLLLLGPIIFISLLVGLLRWRFQSHEVEGYERVPQEASAGSGGVMFDLRRPEEEEDDGILWTVQGTGEAEDRDALEERGDQKKEKPPPYDGIRIA
ncbi:hypothetical protein BT69DRAFT_1279152 [Atractiella rhizophila]|nr:hypothetical protein BT69DRAFT_1279152 [Atractiella rhizophila]